MIEQKRTPEVDDRSYHAFDFEGESFLFDRSTGALFSVASGEGGRISEDEITELVAEISVGQGEEGKMLKFTPVDHDAQASYLESLWHHRPRRIQMLMAQGCNLGCRYCYAWRNGSNQKGTLMPWQIAKETVDYLVEKSGARTDLQVTFFGGEPLLNLPVIRKVVEYCRDLEKSTEKRFTFELITNGTLLEPDVAEWVAAEKFLLFISIDGWKEMHNYNRPAMNGEDMYDVILRNALYAKELYDQDSSLLPIKVRANLTNRYHDAKAVGEYLAGLGFKTVGVGAIEPLPHGSPSPSAMTEDQTDALHETTTSQLKDIIDRLIRSEPVTYYEGILLNKAISALRTTTIKGVTCGVGRNTAIVDNKGKIYPCHRYEGMENYVLGDVFNGLDRELTMGYYRKVNKNATDRCHSCWIRDFCGGGCAWLLSAEDGHLADPTLRECDRRRATVERALWLRQKVRIHFPDRIKGEGELELDSFEWDGVGEEDVLISEFEGGESCGSAKESCETCGGSTGVCGS